MGFKCQVGVPPPKKKVAPRLQIWREGDIVELSIVIERWRDFRRDLTKASTVYHNPNIIWSTTSEWIKQTTSTINQNSYTCDMWSTWSLNYRYTEVTSVCGCVPGLLRWRRRCGLGWEVPFCPSPSEVGPAEESPVFPSSCGGRTGRGKKRLRNLRLFGA